MKYELSSRQTAILITIMLFSLKLLSLPSIIYSESNSKSLFIFICFLIIDFAFLLLILGVKNKHPHFNFYKFVKSKFKTPIFKTIMILFVALFIFKITYLFAEAFNFFQDFAFEDETILKFIIIFFPTVCVVAYNGLKAIGRTLEFFFWIILIGVVICLILSIVPQILTSLKPKQNITEQNYLQTFFKLSFFNGDYVCLLLLIDRVKPTNDLTKKCLFYYLGGVVVLVLLYVAYYRLYQITSTLHPNAIIDIVQYTKGIDYSSSINIISFFTFLMLMFLQGSIYMYCANRCFLKIIKIRHRGASLVFMSFVSILLLLFVFNNFSNALNIVKKYLCYFSIFFWVIVPIILIICFLSKGVKREKYKRLF